jgi:hypothetical protein
MKGIKLSRRTMLRASGVALSLPFLEAMMPRTAHAQAGKALRLVGWYLPNGYYRTTTGGTLKDDWTPTGTGTGYTLSPILQPLLPYKADLQVLTGIRNPPAEMSNISCGHARGTGSFLSCISPSGGGTIGGISMDQAAAAQLKSFTRYASIELGTDSDGGDVPIRSAIAWADANTPLAKETRAGSLFDRLFAGPEANLTMAEKQKRLLYRKSILDSVLGSANGLKAKLGSGDKQKLDGYLNGVRELEQRLAAPAGTAACMPGTRPPPTGDIRTQVKQLIDVMVLAFQCDVTRVSTFMFDRAGSDLAFPFLTANGSPINAGWHGTSHHHGVATNLAQLKAILIWQMEQFAYFLGKLKAIDEGGESILSKSCIFLSSEIGDGDLHEHKNLPVIVAGSAGGALTPGKHVVFNNQPHKSDLFLTLLQSVGVNVTKFGADSTTALVMS